MSARFSELRNGAQSRPMPRLPLPATMPSLATCSDMISTAHSRLAPPSSAPRPRSPHSHNSRPSAAKSASTRSSAHPRPRLSGSRCFHTWPPTTSVRPRRRGGLRPGLRHSRGTRPRCRRAPVRTEPHPWLTGRQASNRSRHRLRDDCPTASEARQKTWNRQVWSGRRPTGKPRKAQGKAWTCVHA